MKLLDRSWPSVSRIVWLQNSIHPGTMSLICGAGILTDTLVSERWSMKPLCVCIPGGERRGGCPVVWLASLWQNRLFISHLVLVTVERMASYQRGDRGFITGYGANNIADGPFLVHGKRRAASHPQLPSFSPFPKPA
jgi:hypothetical protein